MAVVIWCCLGWSPLQSGAATKAPLLLVTGYGSDNVVMFDTESGSWSQLLRLKPRSRPRGITVTETGEVFIGLHSRSKDIVRFSAVDGFRAPVTLTRKIGRFGPGSLVRLEDGLIYTSGDTERTLLRVDPTTGNVNTITAKNCCTMVGILVLGNRLLAGEYFQRSVLEFDLSKERPVGRRLIEKSPHLNRPMGLVVGHNGNLFVSNGLEPTVVEFDLKSGEYIRTFIDLGDAAKDGIYGMIFAPDIGRYFLTTGSHLHEFGTAGELVASYNSPALIHGYNLAAVPAPVRNAFLKSHRATARRTDQPGHRISILKAADGKLEINGTIGERYQVFATSDFTEWKEIGILENHSGVVRFEDKEANELNKCFYRFAIVSSGSPRK